MSIAGEEEKNLGCLTSIMASKSMAHITDIEDLPEDVLSEILIRVGQCCTAEQMAGVFVVSKTFQNRLEDRNVLRAISFIHLFPLLTEQYELLLEVGGLVARCAKASNPDAEFIIAQLLMVSASKLLKAKMGVAQDEDAFLDKATRLLHHFSAENTDITELLHLIRNFLSQVDFEGLHKMRRHIRHFVILYSMPGKKHQRQQFLFCVDKLCLKNCPPPAYTLLPLPTIILAFNQLCVTVHNMKQNMGCAEEQLSPVLQCMVDGNDIDDVVCDTFLEHLDSAEPTLRIQGQVASAFDDEVFELNSFISGRLNYLRYELTQVMDYDAFFRDARLDVLLTFDLLFNVQPDAP